MVLTAIHTATVYHREHPLGLLPKKASLMKLARSARTPPRPAAAGMSERSARKWQSGPLPSTAKAPRWRRPREDPFAEVWQSGVVPQLVADTDGRLQLIAVIEDPAVIERVLRHLGLPTDISEARPARPPRCRYFSTACHRWGRRPDPRRHPLLNASPRRPARPACPTCALPHRCRLWRGAFSAAHSLLTPAHSCG